MSKPKLVSSLPMFFFFTQQVPTNAKHHIKKKAKQNSNPATCLVLLLIIYIKSPNIFLMFAHGFWIFLSLCSDSAADPADPADALCSSEKIFARAVADECGPLEAQSPTLDWTAFTGEIFEPWPPVRSPSLYLHEPYPDASCMEYLPTFTPKMAQM